MKKERVFIYVAVSGDRNVIKKEAKKILKYKELTTANRVYVEFKNLLAVSCAVLVLYLSCLASLSMPLVALSSTNRVSPPRQHLGKDSRHARPLTSSVLTIPSWPHLLCTVHAVSGSHLWFRWILVRVFVASHNLTVMTRVELSSLFTCCIYSFRLRLLSK